MKFIITVTVAVLLGAAFAPSIGPAVREQLVKGANWVVENTETKDTKTKVGEKGRDGHREMKVIADTMNQTVNNVVKAVKEMQTDGGKKK